MMRLEFTLLAWSMTLIFCSAASGIYYETILEPMEGNDIVTGEGSSGLPIDKPTADLNNNGDNRMETLRNRVVYVAMGLQFLQDLWPFGAPIFHLSVILPKKDRSKPGTTVMLTLEYTKRNGPAFSMKTFTNMLANLDIIYYLNNKWFFKDWRHTCATAVYFEGERMWNIVPAQLAKDLGQVYDEVSQKYGLLDRSSLEGICKGMQQQIVGIPQFMDNLSHKWAPLLTAMMDNAAEVLRIQQRRGKYLTGMESCQAMAACDFVGQLQMNRITQFPQLNIQYKEPLKPVIGPSSFERRRSLRKMPNSNN